MSIDVVMMCYDMLQQRHDPPVESVAILAQALGFFTRPSCLCFHPSGERMACPRWVLSALAVLPPIPPVTLSDAFWLFVCLAWLCYCLVCSCGAQDDNDSFRSFDCNQWCGNNDYDWRSDYDYDYDWHDDWSCDDPS